MPRLRPVHNPQGLTNAPRGWRFLYEDEIVFPPISRSSYVLTPLVRPMQVAVFIHTMPRLPLGCSPWNWMPTAYATGARAPLSWRVAPRWTYITPTDA